MSEDATKPLIVVDQISQEFQVGDALVRPLRNVSFTVPPNSFNIIYGPSGSGKSTLLNVLAGLQPPTKGSVTIGHHDLYKLDRDALANFRATKLGFVYQSNYWIKSLNVLDNVAMPLYFMGTKRHQAARQAMQALALVKMESFAKKIPMMLSGGEQQRVAMARALVANPAFIIADEPTGNLDSKAGDQIIDLLRRSQTDFKRTVILVTHNMEYLSLADQLLHIEDGMVAQIQTKPIEKVTEELFTDMRARIKRLSGETNG